MVIGTNDHCGSFNARMATGGIIFGLEFTSQLAFDTGVRHLEIMLATFNKDAVYAASSPSWNLCNWLYETVSTSF